MAKKHESTQAQRNKMLIAIVKKNRHLYGYVNATDFAIALGMKPWTMQRRLAILMRIEAARVYLPEKCSNRLTSGGGDGTLQLALIAARDDARRFAYDFRTREYNGKMYTDLVCDFVSVNNAPDETDANGGYGSGSASPSGGFADVADDDSGEDPF